MFETPELGNHAIGEDLVRWTAGSQDHLFQQSDNTWTAFTQDSSAQRQDVVGQWWPTSAVEESTERVVTNQNAVNLRLISIVVSTNRIKRLCFVLKSFFIRFISTYGGEHPDPEGVPKEMS